MTASKVGRTYYGKTAVQIFGANGWEAHDATKTWSDGGEIKSELLALTERLEAIVARNVSAAVVEYATTGEAAVRADTNGEIYVGLRLWNDEAALIVEVPLKALLVAALVDVRDKLALDPGAHTMISQLVDLGRQLTQLTRTQQAVPPSAARSSASGQEPMPWQNRRPTP